MNWLTSKRTGTGVRVGLAVALVGLTWLVCVAVPRVALSQVKGGTRLATTNAAAQAWHHREPAAAVGVAGPGAGNLVAQTWHHRPFAAAQTGYLALLPWHIGKGHVARATGAGAAAATLIIPLALLAVGVVFGLRERRLATVTALPVAESSEQLTRHAA